VGIVYLNTCHRVLRGRLVHYQDEVVSAVPVYVSGLIFLGLTMFFLFNFNFGRYWSVWLIAAGVIILLNAILPD
jgi:hypothetical protein